MTARLLNLTPAEYRRDPLNGVPWLSQSIANILLSQSPLHAWNRHPKLGGIDRPPSRALDDGTIIHKLLLGTGAAEIAVLPHDEYRTNAAKADRDAALAAGKIPIKQKDYAVLMETAGHLATRLKSLGIPFQGQPEVGVTWDEEGANGPVHCTAMWDLVDIENGIIVDFKSARSAHPNYCRRAFTEYGCAVQGTAYVRALEALKPELTGRVKMLFVFAELTPPYGILPAVMGPAMQELGENQWTKAVRVWERCLATDTWPGYSRGNGDVVELEPMPYALARAMEEAIEEEENGT